MHVFRGWVRVSYYALSRTCESPSRGSKLRGKNAHLVRVGYLPVDRRLLYFALWRGGLLRARDCFFVLCLLLARVCFFLPRLSRLTLGVWFSRRAAALRALFIARASARLVTSTSCVNTSSASPTLILPARLLARLRFSASLRLLLGARSIGRSLVVFN